MGSLYDTIFALCESRGIKGGKMCTDLGISKGLLTDLKMGRTVKPAAWISRIRQCSTCRSSLTQAEREITSATVPFSLGGYWAK